jgi:integrase
LKSAQEKNIIPYVPSASIGFRKVKKRDRLLLTIEELNKIFNSPLWTLENQRIAFLTLCLTGLRGGEVCALQNQNVYTNYLDIKHSYSKKYGLGESKTRTCRYVTIPEKLNNLFAKNNELWIFQNREKNEPITPHSIYMNFVKICNSLNIDVKDRNLTMHSLRNFFISYMQGKNIPLQKIKAIVGHSDSTMTDWYTYWTCEMFNDVYELQNELFSLITLGGNYEKR